MLPTVMQPQQELLQKRPFFCQLITETIIYDDTGYLELSGRLRTELDQLQLLAAEARACENMLDLWRETAVSTHIPSEFVTFSC
ncbi:MAG: hypothetical protein DHS20C20_33750 [Ardenticatenaceae bacterium]|nr:MAG: hypothetical protein DHS20C20_33750 [Ardenticatenaceae bacterium]